MNGVKYCEYVKGSDDWNQRVDKSKFKAKDFENPRKVVVCKTMAMKSPSKYQNSRSQAIAKQLSITVQAVNQLGRPVFF